MELGHSDHRITNEYYRQCLREEQRQKLVSARALVTALSIERITVIMHATHTNVTECPARMIERLHMQVHIVPVIQHA